MTIKTIQEAKEFFQSMGCSHFRMCKENPTLYNEYISQKITYNIENEWTKETFYNLKNNLMDDKYPKSLLWQIYSQMADLLFILKSEEELKMMLEVTQFVKDKLPNQDIHLVIECINGSFDNHGLIHLAHELNDIPTAKALSDLSLYLSDYKFAILNRKRKKDAYQKSKEVSLELGLKE